jgi:hypothetical protein
MVNSVNDKFSDFEAATFGVQSKERKFSGENSRERAVNGHTSDVSSLWFFDKLPSLPILHLRRCHFTYHRARETPTQCITMVTITELQKQIKAAIALWTRPENQERRPFSSEQMVTMALALQAFPMDYIEIVDWIVKTFTYYGNAHKQSGLPRYDMWDDFNIWLTMMALEIPDEQLTFDLAYLL